MLTISEGLQLSKSDIVTPASWIKQGKHRVTGIGIALALLSRGTKAVLHKTFPFAAGDKEVAV